MTAAVFWALMLRRHLSHLVNVRSNCFCSWMAVHFGFLFEVVYIVSSANRYSRAF